jgi:hypothetical protein
MCPECGYKFDKVYIDGKMQPLKAVEFNKPADIEPPEWIDVRYVKMSIHSNRKKKTELIKVEIIDEVMSYPVWICLPDYYQGFAVKQGEQKWRWFFDDFVPFPQTVREAMDREPLIKSPDRALIRKKGKFWEVLQVAYDRPPSKFEDDVPF